MSRRPAPEKQVDKMLKIFTSAAAILILSYPFASLPVYAESFTGSPAAVSENVTEDVTEDMTEDVTEVKQRKQKTNRKSKMMSQKAALISRKPRIMNPKALKK